MLPQERVALEMWILFSSPCLWVRMSYVKKSCSCGWIIISLRHTVSNSGRNVKFLCVVFRALTPTRYSLVVLRGQIPPEKYISMQKCNIITNVRVGGLKSLYIVFVLSNNIHKDSQGLWEYATT